MKRFTVPLGNGNYQSAYSKYELVKHIGIIEDAMDKTGNTEEDRRRWQRFFEYVIDSDKTE